MRTALLSIVVVIATLTVAARTAAAQKSCAFLVAPSGGAFDVPLHPSYVTSVTLPARVTSAKTSDITEYEIRPDGEAGLLLHPKTATAAPANISIQTGTIRVSLAMHAVGDAKDACTFVTLTVTTEEEARQRAIDDAVAVRTAALEAKVAAIQREQAATVRNQLDAALADRAVARLDVVRLKAVARNDAGVVAWVLRAAYFGRDLVLQVEIENRTSGAIRVADLELRDGSRNVATAARLAGGGAPPTLGSLASGATLRGVVYARDLDPAGKALSLVLRLQGGGQVVVRGLGLK